MTFEEDFPSLCRRELDDDLMNFKYLIGTLCGEVDSCNYVEDAEYVDIEGIKQHCLDKKKVRETILYMEFLCEPGVFTVSIDKTIEKLLKDLRL